MKPAKIALFVIFFLMASDKAYQLATHVYPRYIEASRTMDVVAMVVLALAAISYLFEYFNPKQEK